MSHSHDTARAVNALTVSNTLTMSSREIAELVDSRHDKVKQSIERLAERGVIVHPPMGDEHETDALGRDRVTKVYHLCKRDSLIVVAQLCPEFTARIIDRWQELEAKLTPTFEIPTTLSSALRLAAEQAERIEQQAQQLEAAKPAVEFVGRYVESTGSKTFRQVCKLLKANEARFREFLRDWKIMYRLGGEWTPYAEHLDAGRFQVCPGTSETTQHAFNQAKFTPKGIAWVAGLWAKYQLETNQDEGARRA